MENEINIDQFIGKVHENNGSLVITIPVRNARFSGIQKGDYLKLWYKKQQQVEE